MSSQPHHGNSATSRQFPAYNPVAPVTAPAGTLLPGTKIQVGSHRVVVERYLSEGGFAHVYVVRLPQPVNGSETAVLKRVAVPDKAALANMRTEVETMKKLKGHRHIVKYIDSHASQLRGGGYEVFLVMEFCAGGGLIDFMNTRLQHRLTEPEIIKIFSDVAEGVACMHYLKPPLLHRDLKVENVLISGKGNSATYKLCDFGSSAPPRPAATSAAEGRLIEDDVQRHTTLQYRSPEMIDVYRKQPIDEKSDIWALGVFLYKLCYYTTPFEEVGHMAILNATFKYPSYPSFSSRLKLFIGSMLKEDPRNRPNIYEVVREVCNMQGKEVPIKDIYSKRSVSEVRKYQELPPTPTEAPAVGAIFSPPMQETEIIPEIAPMRRGRPGKSPSSQPSSERPNASPYRATAEGSSNDPFAALDGSAARTKTAEEMSKRFPSLDQFDILHEKGDKFEFEPTVESKPEDEDLSRRLTNALADDAFARRVSPERVPKPVYKHPSQTSPVLAPNLREIPAPQAVPLYQPTPQRPAMVSTGTMTSPIQTPRLPELISRPIYRFPSSDNEHRSSSEPFTIDEEQRMTRPHQVPSPQMSSLNVEGSSRLPSDRISSQSNSAHPSMETLRLPPALEITDPVGRSKSATGKARPMSVQSGVRYDLPRDSESPRSSLDMPRLQYEGGAPLRSVRTDMDRESDRTISSDIDYLRAMEEEESNRKREKRSSGSYKYNKRASLSTLSLSGGKNLFSSRFGDAFRRFEAGNQEKSASPSAEDAPQQGLAEVSDSSEDSLSSNDEIALEDVNRDDISPEMRRELERRRLSQEEKRVANAAAEYRRRVAEGDGGGRAIGDGTRSLTILNKVQSLLGESEKPTIPKTATGYGRFTETSSSLQAKQSETRTTASASSQLHASHTSGPTYTRDGSRTLPDRPDGPNVSACLPQSVAPTSYPLTQRPTARPTAPPKPKSLRTGSATSRPGSGHGSSEETGEDWEAKFSQRFPSLSGLEMETEITIPKISSLRTREV
ncbi:Serine/threonine protein kinase, putative [Penicillium digitatum]|uniref:non-specific serine/threonine protein kinase n=3 Tax=Penicillium digitatum TaxID=36651 RepID=K9FN60_PEND2|nr:Serine/threonine protein kinase, putative [Penicillium digitatum Pd1]EKV08264.1 Serine/threonine protein kinase, putative [Penicillium digitatum Pd1]EKV09767.1 Serine/threonine protein kinase, putative [Penicillium digitatum PHI26]QQK41621.1 Serine/threonine protein kinase, putative [Penicillium digitatum]